jgi:hypothetical protein
MPSPLHEICCARIAPESLGALAGLRCTARVEVLTDEEGFWLRWAPGDDEVLRHLLPVAGATFFCRRDGKWYRHGSRLPVAGPPPGEVRRLDQLIVPEPIRCEPPTAMDLRRQPMQLVRDTMPRQATALQTTLAALAEWADHATTLQITALRCACSESRILLLGARLPLMAGMRFWGERLLVPLGYRVEPALPEKVLAEALGVPEDGLALLDESGCEIVPIDAFRPLHRAAVRLAVGDRP